MFSESLTNKDQSSRLLNTRQRMYVNGKSLFRVYECASVRKKRTEISSRGREHDASKGWGWGWGTETGARAYGTRFRTILYVKPTHICVRVGTFLFKC